MLRGREVLAESARRAELLWQAGSRRVALALDNGVDWALWDLALLRAGLVCVPLPGFFSAEQQRHVLDSAGIDTLIAADPAMQAALGFRVGGHGLGHRDVAAPPALHEGTAKITFTSGTTGRPKGVCLSTATMLAVAESLRVACAPAGVDRHLCALPLATLLENIAGLYAPWLAGAEVELMPMANIGLLGSSRFDVPAFLGALQASRPNSLILLPQMLLALVAAAEAGMPVPDTLRFIAVGGGRFAPQLLRRADALGLPVYEGYGLSECASVVCLNAPGARHIGAVGRPLPHLGLRIAGDGEVLVKGPRLLGYLGEPPVEGEWLGTGDLGHFEDGFLVLHGRKKHQFITAFGRNVSPEWVEAELVQQAPIAQAWLHGEALPANVAVLVPRAPSCRDEDLAAAVAQVNAGLPDYARVHRWLRSPVLPEGLATANGRLRREAMFDHFRPAIEAIALQTP